MKKELFKALYFGEISEDEVSRVLEAYRQYNELNCTLREYDAQLKLELPMSEDEKRKQFIFAEIDAGRIENRLIPVIKAVRVFANLGLKEAKDWCDTHFEWRKDNNYERSIAR